MRTPSIALAIILVAAPSLVLADGLTAAPAGWGGLRWQARVEVETIALQPVGSPFGLGNTAGPQIASQQTAWLFGDYRLDSLRLGQTGRMRVTSGLLLSQRSGTSAADADSRNTLPYLGLGYSGGGLQGSWGFNADIGMSAQTPGAAARLGRVFSGNFNMGDMLRDMRLQPVVRLGVNYSF